MVGIIIAFIVGLYLGLLFGCYKGEKNGRESVEFLAIQSGAATWGADESGRPKIVWKVTAE